MFYKNSIEPTKKRESECNHLLRCIIGTWPYFHVLLLEAIAAAAAAVLSGAVLCWTACVCHIWIRRWKNGMCTDWCYRLNTLEDRLTNSLDTKTQFQELWPSFKSKRSITCEIFYLNAKNKWWIDAILFTCHTIYSRFGQFICIKIFQDWWHVMQTICNSQFVFTFDSNGKKKKK